MKKNLQEKINIEATLPAIKNKFSPARSTKRASHK